MMMIIAAAQEPGTDHVDDKPEACNRDRLTEGNRHRRQEPDHRLVADQKCYQRQYDGARETGKITNLAGSETEPCVGGVLARKGVRERRDQHGNRVRGHVQTVGDQCQRTEGDPAADLDQHHGRAESDHRPGLAFIGRVPGS